ncbi:hypothetical protein MCEGE10_02433 [Flavobacteriaceae bacterium]
MEDRESTIDLDNLIDLKIDIYSLINIHNEY